MEKRFVGPSLLIVTVMGCLLLTRDARTAPGYVQTPAPVSEAYVQVTSVTVEPPTIHKSQNPYSNSNRPGPTPWPGPSEPRGHNRSGDKLVRPSK